MRSLDITSNDSGMISMKRSLNVQWKSVLVISIESISFVSLSCLLDPRYKRHFFRNKKAYRIARQSLITQLNSLEEPIPQASLSPMSSGDSDSFMSMMKNIIKDNESVEILEDIEAEIVVDRYLNTPVTDSCMEFGVATFRVTSMKINT